VLCCEKQKKIQALAEGLDKRRIPRFKEDPPFCFHSDRIICYTHPRIDNSQPHITLTGPIEINGTVGTTVPSFNRREYEQMPPEHCKMSRKGTFSVVSPDMVKLPKPDKVSEIKVHETLVIELAT
jgi:hypothetical protein